uniref:Uncharacterized protein n=1 Tax=Quercus lobata TaxID=97700 RepID=A0A7N2M0E4_QUELO
MHLSGVCPRKGCNWDILIQNFDSVLLNDLIVEKVLLELKVPTNAKQALAFFHWSALRKKFEHAWELVVLYHNSYYGCSSIA